MITLNDPIKLLMEEIQLRVRDKKKYNADLKLAVEAVNLASTETAYWKARCAAAENKLIDILLFNER